jgi:hypothetical protein
MRCLPEVCRPNARTAPILFLNICTTWAEIAFSTPALWVTIHVDFPCAEGFDQLFNSYLTHSRSRMLFVTFSGEPDKNISRALCQHADRVHKLELLEFPTHRDDLLPLASFSGLKALMLAVQDDSGGDGSTIHVASLLDMLREMCPESRSAHWTTSIWMMMLL